MKLTFSSQVTLDSKAPISYFVDFIDIFLDFLRIIIKQVPQQFIFSLLLGTNLTDFVLSWLARQTDGQSNLLRSLCAQKYLAKIGIELIGRGHLDQLVELLHLLPRLNNEGEQVGRNRLQTKQFQVH